MINGKFIFTFKALTGFLFFSLLVFTGCSSRQFVVSPKDENVTQEFRTYSSDYDTVWKCLHRVVSDFRFQNDQKDKGLLQTYWKTRVIKEKGRLRTNDNYMHGNVIEDRTDEIPQNQMGDFELRERLSIVVNRSTDSTTTVTVSYHFKAKPYGSQGVVPEVENDVASYARKAYSPWDFYTKQEHIILEKVSEMLKEKQEKESSK